MKQSDKHTWIKTDEQYIHKCKTCGCKRTKEVHNGESFLYYQRSGIIYGLTRPDCLDWNDNKLD